MMEEESYIMLSAWQMLMKKLITLGDPNFMDVLLREVSDIQQQFVNLIHDSCAVNPGSALQTNDQLTFSLDTWTCILLDVPEGSQVSIKDFNKLYTSIKAHSEATVMIPMLTPKTEIVEDTDDIAQCTNQLKTENEDDFSMHQEDYYGEESYSSLLANDTDNFMTPKKEQTRKGKITGKTGRKKGDKSLKASAKNQGGEKPVRIRKRVPWEEQLKQLKWHEDFWEDEESFNLMKEGEKPLRCCKCLIVLNSLYSLIKHWKRANCERLGLRGIQLWKEEKIEGTGQKKYSCTHPECMVGNRLWGSKQAVHGHWQTHHKEYAAAHYGVASCNMCDEKFVTQTLCNSHFTKVHGGQGQKYTCSLCGVSMSNKKALDDHERRHRGDKPFSCEYCSQAFSGKNALRLHQTRHHPTEIGYTPKSHICDLCGKSFKTAWNLKEHRVSKCCSRFSPLK